MPMEQTGPRGLQAHKRRSQQGPRAGRHAGEGRRRIPCYPVQRHDLVISLHNKVCESAIRGILLNHEMSLPTRLREAARDCEER